MMNLNGVKMNVVKTASNGVVNHHTIFCFSQKSNKVTARYSGGLVKRGFLIGNISNNQLEFNYAQVHEDGNVEGGKSNCMIRLDKGKLQLIESFDWGAGTGQNVFQQMD